MSKSVNISAAVAKALEASKRSADEILREALGVRPEGFEIAAGVVLPEGTAMLAWYKDRPYWGKIKDGAIEIMDQRFFSVSSAAASFTKRQTTNGYELWQAKLPGRAEFVPIRKLKEQAA